MPIHDAAIEAIPLSNAHSDVRAQIVRRAAHRTHTEPVRNTRRTGDLRPTVVAERRAKVGDQEGP
jgi:hypothetical protein